MAATTTAPPKTAPPRGIAIPVVRTPHGSLAATGLGLGLPLLALGTLALGVATRRAGRSR
jgi:hypothetical protein